MSNYKVIAALLILCLLMLSPAVIFADEEEIPVSAVSLNPREIILVLGQEAEVRATVYPLDATNQEVQWTNSDPEIVEIDEAGLNVRVISLYPGEATITVNTEDGGFRTQCKITVIVLVRSIGINEEDIFLNPGDSVEIEAWVEPRNATDQRITWESSDTAIVQVDEDGVAKAVKPGQARIIARSVENEMITAYQTITVEEFAPVPDVTEDELITEPLDQDHAVADINMQYLYVGLAVVLAGVGIIIFIIHKRKKNTSGEQIISKSAKGPFVVGETGIFAGHSFHFTDSQLVFGRDPSTCHIVYPPEHDLISRRHCVVSYNPETGQFNIEDFSSNGTFLAGDIRLELGRRYPLKSGDSFYLADKEELFSVSI